MGWRWTVNPQSIVSCYRKALAGCFAMGESRKSTSKPLHGTGTIQRRCTPMWHMILTDKRVAIWWQITFIRASSQIMAIYLPRCLADWRIISRHSAAVIRSSKSELVVSVMNGQRLSASYRCVHVCRWCDGYLYRVATEGPFVVCCWLAVCTHGRP